ncbi:hypothetical protein SAMN03080594_10863 [Arenibacter palladensis]|uniref:Uncharacterized protein n=2 Tax=Arenibacter palladensis TaxID=237373 RepID=A0A1M5EY64_9FLAO|nr:hypothetical protein SAMN03080594_10863 [Arenibacter palladensis]
MRVMLNLAFRTAKNLGHPIWKSWPTYPDKVREMYKMLFNWELTLERPLWQLERKYEGLAAERMDSSRKVKSEKIIKNVKN